LAENHATAIHSGGIQYGFFNLLKQLTSAEQKQEYGCSQIIKRVATVMHKWSTTQKQKKKNSEESAIQLGLS
jgi:hypothetical protein